jgi:hypothetical protein
LAAFPRFLILFSVFLCFLFFFLVLLQGWVIFSDKLGAIEMARALAMQIHWEARVIDLDNGSDQRLLVCQKPFMKK